MSGYYLWLVVATLLVMIEGYMLPAVMPVVPSLLLVALLVTALQLPLRLVLATALWLGAILDSISLQPFGLYSSLSLLAAGLLFWLIHMKGISGVRLANIALVLLPVHILFLFTLAGWHLLSVGSLGLGLAPLGGAAGQYILTVGFAWLFVGRVQLRV